MFSFSGLSISSCSCSIAVLTYILANLCSLLSCKPTVSSLNPALTFRFSTHKKYMRLLNHGKYYIGRKQASGVGKVYVDQLEETSTDILQRTEKAMCRASIWVLMTNISHVQILQESQI